MKYILRTLKHKTLLIGLYCQKITREIQWIMKMFIVLFVKVKNYEQSNKSMAYQIILEHPKKHKSFFKMLGLGWNAHDLTLTVKEKTAIT